MNASVVVDHSAGGEATAGDVPAASYAATGTRPAADRAWRQEIVSRVQQHRARRRRPADPNALELDFSATSPHSFAPETDHSMPPPPERFAEIVIKPSALQQEPHKVIRFPRPQGPYAPAVEEVRLDELRQAEPALVTPRIFEAAEPEAAGPEAAGPEAAEPDAAEPQPAEPRMAVSQAIEDGEAFDLKPAAPLPASRQMELLPSFADIRLEPEEARIDPDLEIIPQPAPLSQRFASGVVDAGIVLIATGACAFTFVELAEEMPQTRMALLCALAAGGIFWLLLQYIFLTYRRATPGMRVAQLELCTFAGEPTSVFSRQCRAWASTLSALSIGLGYAWALVDEDRLGWHDRISQTYVRCSNQSALSNQPW